MGSSTRTREQFRSAAAQHPGADHRRRPIWDSRPASSRCRGGRRDRCRSRSTRHRGNSRTRHACTGSSPDRSRYSTARGPGRSDTLHPGCRFSAGAERCRARGGCRVRRIARRCWRGRSSFSSAAPNDPAGERLRQNKAPPTRFRPKDGRRLIKPTHRNAQLRRSRGSGTPYR